MKYFSKIILSAVALSSMAFAQDNAAPALPKAALIVQNHVKNADYKDNLLGFADYLSAELSANLMSVIIPENMVGVNQNKDVSGEDLRGTSAVNLCQALGADFLVVASVRDVSLVKRGNPPSVCGLVVRSTINILDGADGSTIAGVNTTAKGKMQSIVAFENAGVSVYEDLMEAAASTAVEDLSKKITVADLQSRVQKIMFAVTCNIPGANVKVDGFSYGTTPLNVELPKGLHEVVVEYPFCVPYKSRANIVSKDGFKLDVVLELTDEGIRRYKDMTMFAEIIDRIKKSGATDDYVRRVLADGEAEFLKNSHFKWDGNIQTLSVGRDGHDDVLYAPVIVK